MERLASLEQIEADLQFCEDVLNSATQPSKLQRRVGSAGASRAQPPCKQSPSPLRPGAAGQKQRLLDAQQQQPQQQQPAAATLGAPPQVPAGAVGPTARTHEELLDMMVNVPAGQPFEVDTRLLYSPQSSYAASRQGSPRHERSDSGDGGVLGSGAGGAGGGSVASFDWAGLDGAGADAFSLPAYRGSSDGLRPLYGDGGQAACELEPLPGGSGGSPWRLQQHAAGPPAGPQQQQQQGSSRHAQRSSPAERRPASAPQRPEGSPARSSGPRSARQLLLDDLSRPLGGGSAQQCTADLVRQGREARLQQLAAPRVELWQRCAEIRVAEERAELQECTFAPRTGRPPSRQRLAPGLAVEDRLLVARTGRAEALERARLEREQEALADCTFAPQLVTQPERHLREEYQPLHRRLGEEQKKRSARLAQARVQQGLADADLSFQPQLNPRSLRLAAEREARELYSPGGAGARARSAGSTAAAAAAEQACTFSPAINAASERLLEDSATVPTDFQERLRYYSLRKQLKQRAAAATADADACTFRPDTGNAVQVLALSSRAGNLLETEQERYERLGCEEAERQAARRAAKQAEVYGGLAFTPQLNPRSRALAPAGSGGVDGLAADAQRQRERLESLRREEEERRRAECTFQPDTRKPRVRGYYDEYQPPQPSAPLSIAAAAKQGFEGLTERIASYQADKAARAAAAKAEEEAARLRECSFAPDINRRRVQAQGPVLVRGLDRYLELKQLAERQRAEADERAAKVFHERPRAKQGATVPQPFQLAGHALLEAKAAERQAARLDSELCQRLQACTFQPQTNHARRREELARLLATAPSPQGSDLA